MRDATDNPFMPGSDAVPEVWAGRVEQLQDWSQIVRPRLLSGMYERGRTILGEPGLGKSTLVRRIAEKARSMGDWTTQQVRLPAGADPLKAVATSILQLADRAGLSASRDRKIKAILDRVRSVSVSGVALTIDRSEGPEPYAALTELLVKVGQAAIKANVVVLIHIDEVQNATDENALSQLLISLGDAIATTTTVELPGGVLHERHLPIAVYLTGLPEFSERASSRNGATFARRFATTTLSPISDDDIRYALSEFVDPGWEVSTREGGTERIRMTPEAADLIVDLCHGEPFLFQLAGQRAWYAGSDDVITVEEVKEGWEEAKYEAASHVERVLDRLPDKEVDFIRAMAALEPGERTATNIAKQMGYEKATNIGPFSQRLDTVRGIISRGKKYTFRHRALEAYLTGEWPEFPA